MTQCTATTLSQLLHLSPARIRQLAQLGILPKAGHGLYELEKAVQGYVLYLRGCLARQRPSAPSQYRKKQIIVDETEAPLTLEPSEKTTWIPLNLARQVIQEQMNLLIEELAALPVHKTKAITALKKRHTLTLERKAPRTKKDTALSSDALKARLLENSLEQAPASIVELSSTFYMDN